MRRRILGTIAAAVVAGAIGLGPQPASATVSSSPAATPVLATSGTDGSVEQVRQIVQCGSTMYAVGRFTQVKNPGSAAIPRNNAFAFSATAPYAITGWSPNPNGQVDTVACAPDGSILLGGTFTTAGGATNSDLARVTGTTGTSLAFANHSAQRVAHIEVVQGHALVGGFFSPRFLISLNPVTGAVDGYGTPAISGNYQFPGVAGNATRVWNMTVSPDRTAVLVSGDFTSVGGQHHEQLFRLNMTPGAATVSAWAPTELFQHCAPGEPFYAQDAAWSPDMSLIYTATTGYKPADNSTTAPRSGPCDAAIAYRSAQSTISDHTWINYTGCDSLYSVAADKNTVFVGGHERWISNPLGCDAAGPGAIAHPGLGELVPATGAYQPGPSRGRGLGADDLLRTDAGLWIASDNQANTSTCAGQTGHMGICFLPG